MVIIKTADKFPFEMFAYNVSALLQKPVSRIIAEEIIVFLEIANIKKYNTEISWPRD